MRIQLGQPVDCLMTLIYTTRWREHFNQYLSLESGRDASLWVSWKCERIFIVKGSACDASWSRPLQPGCESKRIVDSTSQKRPFHASNRTRLAILSPMRKISARKGYVELNERRHQTKRRIVQEFRSRSNQDTWKLAVSGQCITQTAYQDTGG